MPIRTDLAMEAICFDQKNKNDTNIANSKKNSMQKQFPIGTTFETIVKNKITIHRLVVKTDEGAKAIGKAKGEYITIETGDFKELQCDFCNEIDIIASILQKMLPQNCKNVLVIGLGNSDITPDALGPLAISSIFCTRHIDETLQKQIGLVGLCDVCAIAPGVLGQTGIESAEVVKALVDSVSPDCVIAIDALAARSVQRLATTVQISNAGIAPGSGVLNKRKELTFATLGIPIIAVGVPTVVDMATIACDIFNMDDNDEKLKEAQTMMVTPREIDLAVGHAAKTVAFAINKALQPSLTLDELITLVS